LEDLCKKYGSHWAVDEANFVVPKGWTVGLLGGNGAGKTITIAMIMGLVIPTAGRATVLGCDMARDGHRVLSRMNFESPYVARPAARLSGAPRRHHPLDLAQHAGGRTTLRFRGDHEQRPRRRDGATARTRRTLQMRRPRRGLHPSGAGGMMSLFHKPEASLRAS